ncbi:unnamed protein product [Amoebophrya sp. A25]|nr:unnamed protein product [Amoebophrya sp. A25]|eukprot:GSA25T00005200001.1
MLERIVCRCRFALWMVLAAPRVSVSGAPPVLRIFEGSPDEQEPSLTSEGHNGRPPFREQEKSPTDMLLAREIEGLGIAGEQQPKRLRTGLSPTESAAERAALHNRTRAGSDVELAPMGGIMLVLYSGGVLDGATNNEGNTSLAARAHAAFQPCPAPVANSTAVTFITTPTTGISAPGVSTGDAAGRPGGPHFLRNNEHVLMLAPDVNFSENGCNLASTPMDHGGCAHAGGGVTTFVNSTTTAPVIASGCAPLHASSTAYLDAAKRGAGIIPTSGDGNHRGLSTQNHGGGSSGGFRLPPAHSSNAPGNSVARGSRQRPPIPRPGPGFAPAAREAATAQQTGGRPPQPPTRLSSATDWSAGQTQGSRNACNECSRNAGQGYNLPPLDPRCAPCRGNTVPVLSSGSSSTSSTRGNRNAGGRSAPYQTNVPTAPGGALPEQQESLGPRRDERRQSWSHRRMLSQSGSSRSNLSLMGEQHTQRSVGSPEAVEISPASVDDAFNLDRLPDMLPSDTYEPPYQGTHHRYLRDGFPNLPSSAHSEVGSPANTPVRDPTNAMILLKNALGRNVPDNVVNTHSPFPRQPCAADEASVMKGIWQKGMGSESLHGVSVSQVSTAYNSPAHDPRGRQSMLLDVEPEQLFPRRVLCRGSSKPAGRSGTETEFQTFEQFEATLNRRFARTLQAGEIAENTMRNDLLARSKQEKPLILDFDLVDLFKRFVVLVNVPMSPGLWQSVRNMATIMNKYGYANEADVISMLAYASWYFSRLRALDPDDAPIPYADFVEDGGKRIPEEHREYVREKRAERYKNCDGHFAPTAAETNKMIAILLQLAHLIIYDQHPTPDTWRYYLVPWIGKKDPAQPGMTTREVKTYSPYSKKHFDETCRWILRKLEYRLMDHDQFWTRYHLLSGRNPATTWNGPLSPRAWEENVPVGEPDDFYDYHCPCPQNGEAGSGDVDAGLQDQGEERQFEIVMVEH